jgi:CxxC motif-containing protein (DUF1111 family)
MRLGGVVSVIATALFACGHAVGVGEVAPDPAGSADGRGRPPGGATTHARPPDREAFSQPSANLSLARDLDFKIGRRLFRRSWVSAPASTRAADGLGPLFNARSCEGCHARDGRGHPPDRPGEPAVSLVVHVSVPPRTEAERRDLAGGRIAAVPEPTYGLQIQPFAIQGHAAEGRVHVAWDELPIELRDGARVSLRRPRYALRDLGYGPLRPDAQVSPRVAPQMIGLGLLEAIPEPDLLARADPEDADGDGISGRPRLVWSDSEQRMRVGRFGWKAGAPGVDAQAHAAFSLDLGMGAPLHPSGAGDCTVRQLACRRAPTGGDPDRGGLEVAPEIAELVVFYARNLAVPARRGAGDPEVAAGERIFHDIGCARCHVPGQRTRADAIGPEQSGQAIWPYTDLLLHDLGEDLADDRPEGMASGREWRTPPLWGIGLTPVVSGRASYLHDGRARSLLEAILWHAGEARPQRDAVADLPAADRDRLIRFVESL